MFIFIPLYSPYLMCILYNFILFRSQLTVHVPLNWSAPQIQRGFSTSREVFLGHPCNFMRFSGVDTIFQSLRMTTKDMFAAFDGLRAVKVRNVPISRGSLPHEKLPLLSRHLESVAVMRVRPLLLSWSWSALIQTLEVGLPGMCFELVFDFTGLPKITIWKSLHLHD